MVELEDFFKNIGVTSYILLIPAMAGIYFLAANGLKSGYIFLFLFLISIAMIFITYGLAKNNDSLDDALSFLEKEESVTPRKSAILYLAGLVTLIPLFVIQLIGNLPFSISIFSIPFFQNEISQSFSIAATENSMPWKLFNNVYTAGTIESYSFLFAFILVGMTLAWFIGKSITDDEDSFFHSKIFYYIVTIVLVVGLFTGAHVLNADYTTSNFIAAGVFMVLQTVVMLIYPQSFSYWLGFHQMNNLIFMIKVFGFKAVAAGFFSLFGLFFVIFLAFMIFLAIRKSKD